MRTLIGRCALGAGLALLVASTNPAHSHAQVAGGDVRAGIWAFMWGEHERWPELGGRLRFGAPGGRTQFAVDLGLAFDLLYAGTWQTLGATVIREPGLIGRHLWYVGGGYTALHASAEGATGFAHAAQALVGVHLGRGLRSRWSLESRFIIGPDREREDNTEEPVRYLSVGVDWRLGPTSSWRSEP
jgi:hypothetical protein